MAYGDDAFGTEQSTSTEGTAPATEQEFAAFFDATKVPAELQPTFKEMQAAWTKKTQGLGEAYNVFEELGGIEEAVPFIKQFTSPEGTIAWFKHIASEIGTDAAAQLLGIEFEDEAYDDSDFGYDDEELDDDFDQPMTRAEFLEWQEAQQAQKRAEVEDAQLAALFDTLGINDDSERYFVANAALKHPVHLGMEERLRRGASDHQKYLDAKLEARSKQRQEIEANGVGGLGGGTPSSDTDGAPQTFADAREAAMQYLKSIQT